MNREETARLLAVLRAVWPEAKVGNETVTGWQMALSDLSYDDAMGAAQVWLRTGTFFPKPAELRAILAEASAAIPEWEAAWEEVMACVRRHGSYVGPQWGNDGGQWSSDLIGQVLSHLGGYLAVCQTDVKDLPTMRAQFRDFWKRRRESAVLRSKVGDALPTADRPALKAVGD